MAVGALRVVVLNLIGMILAGGEVHIVVAGATSGTARDGLPVVGLRRPS